MEWEARMTEELETALNSGEMRRALEILAEMKGRGMRLRVICDESKSQESIHSPFPFAPPPYVGDSFRSRHDKQETPSWRSQQGLPGKVEAFEIEERPAVVCSPVKVPSGFERPGPFRPQEKAREDSLHSGFERPAVFKPQEKLRKDSSSPDSSPHSLLKPTPPSSWLKPKQQAVQEFQTIRSEFSSVSYSKLP